MLDDVSSGNYFLEENNPSFNGNVNDFDSVATISEPNLRANLDDHQPLSSSHLAAVKSDSAEHPAWMRAVFNTPYEDVSKRI